MDLNGVKRALGEQLGREQLAREATRDQWGYEQCSKCNGEHHWTDMHGSVCKWCEERGE